MASKHYVIYTDGAYSSSRSLGGSAFIILNDNNPVLIWNKTWKNGTNNTAEMLAVLFALKSFKTNIDSITIYSDSMYVIGSLTLNWKRKKNIKLWEMLDTELDRVKELCPKIEFIHVKGHESDYWNNRVDYLAVEASKTCI